MTDPLVPAAAPTVVTSTADLVPSGVAGYAKAIGAGVTAALAAVGTALADGAITTLEWVGIAGAGIGAAVVAFGLANKVEPVVVVPKVEPVLGVVQPPPPEPQL